MGDKSTRDMVSFFFPRKSKHNNNKLPEEVAAATTTTTKHDKLLADFCTGWLQVGNISGHRSVAQQMKAQDQVGTRDINEKQNKKEQENMNKQKDKIIQIEINDFSRCWVL